jgi:hypothetical protein
MLDRLFEDQQDSHILMLIGSGDELGTVDLEQLVG